MNDITEKRVYDDDAGVTEVFVAAGIGVVSVSISADRVGRFGVVRRCSPRDVAGGDGLLAVATDEDVLVRDHRGPTSDDDAFASTAFGPASAVGVRNGTVLAGDGDGRIVRRGGEGWADVGTIDASVVAIDGPLLATDDGVYRVRGEGDDTAVEPAGLEAANDVAARGPFAAADDGLYALGNGWMREVEGRFGAVAATSREHAHAAVLPEDTDDARQHSDGAFYERHDGGWRAVDLPVEGPIADVAEGERPYALTIEGTLLIGPEWRSRSLGVDDIVGIAVA